MISVGVTARAMISVTIRFTIKAFTVKVFIGLGGWQPVVRTRITRLGFRVGLVCGYDILLSLTQLQGMVYRGTVQHGTAQRSTQRHATACHCKICLLTLAIPRSVVPPHCGTLVRLMAVPIYLGKRQA